MKSFKDMTKSGEAKRADAMKFKLSDIYIEPDFNVREESERLEEHIEDLHQFILAGGHVPPLEVRPREEGGVWVVDGFCRRAGYERAIKSGAPIEWIEVRPFTGNDADRIARLATSNEGLKLTPLELSNVYKRLRGMGLDVPEIAKRVFKTPQHVAQTLCLADANLDVQQAVAAGDIAATTAIEVVKKHGDNAGAEIVKLKAVAAAKGRTRVTRTAANKTMKLSALESKALDFFLSAHHDKWKEVAETFMTADERRNLERRLTENDDH